jgi:hypothetical protein
MRRVRLVHAGAAKAHQVAQEGGLPQFAGADEEGDSGGSFKYQFS